MTLRTAVVGAGVVSRKHLEGLQANPSTDLVGICDIDTQRAEAAAAKYDIPAYTDLDRLIDEAALDWVHLCTPVQTHFDLAATIIEAGIPVLIEKPVTESVEEVVALERLADEHGVYVSVVHQHLYDPAMRAARRSIEAGRLGDVRGVDLMYVGMTRPDEPNRGSWTFDLPGGEFEEGLPHPIYLVLDAGGLPRDEASLGVSTALYGDYEGDFAYDGAQVQYVSESGTLCSMMMLADATPQRSMHVHGESGSLVVDFLSQTVVHLGGDYAGSNLGKARNNLDRARGRIAGTVKSASLAVRSQLTNDWETSRKADPHQYLFDREAKRIASDANPPVDLERARWTIAIMERIRQASLPVGGDAAGPAQERTEPPARTNEFS